MKDELYLLLHSSVFRVYQDSANLRRNNSADKVLEVTKQLSVHNPYFPDLSLPHARVLSARMYPGAQV